MRCFWWHRCGGRHARPRWPNSAEIKRCLPGEVKIGVGNGSLVATDVRPDDGAYGPGMLYPLRILT